MWHEARKQEKKLRGMIVDYRRRAERRREYYEKIKADPTQFMQIHGRPCKIHLEPQISIAAEKSMMGWQGGENLIDRFDVRAHLDMIPEFHSPGSNVESDMSVKDVAQLNYERYRILVQNDLAGTGEEKFLHQIHLEEQFGSSSIYHGKHHDKKKEPKAPKAAISYTYEDSTPKGLSASAVISKGTWSNGPSPSGSTNPPPPAEESDDDFDIDLIVNFEDLNHGQKSEMNNHATKYGMGPGDFEKYFVADLEEKEKQKLAKLQEEEKLAMSGRKARRERRAFKDRIISRRGYISPPSYAAKASPGKEEEEAKSSSGSDTSRSPSPEKIEFITSFDSTGNIDQQNQNKKSLYGPDLPPLNLPQKYDRKKYFKSSPPPARQGSSAKNSRSRSTSRTRHPSYRRSSVSPRRKRLHRRRSRSRSRHRRRKRSSSSSTSSSSSRGYSSRRGRRSRRSRSHSYSRSRTRSSSRHRVRSRRSSSSSPRKARRRRSVSVRRSRTSRSPKSRRRRSTSSPSPPRTSKTHNRPDTKQIGSETNNSHTIQPNSKTDKKEDGSKLPSPPVKRYYGRSRRTKKSSSSELSASPSASDSEVSSCSSGGKGLGKIGESIPLPSKSSIIASSKVSTSPSLPSSKIAINTPSASSKAKNPRERLRKRMQAALNKQLKADKEAEKFKHERQLQERIEREESLRELSIKYRRREREKRHKLRENNRSSSVSSTDSSHSDSSGYAKRFSRSPSRSRSRSDSGHRSPLTSY